MLPKLIFFGWMGSTLILQSNNGNGAELIFEQMIFSLFSELKLKKGLLSTDEIKRFIFHCCLSKSITQELYSVVNCIHFLLANLSTPNTFHGMNSVPD